MGLNYMDMNVTLKRIEVIDMMLACVEHMDHTGHPNKWNRLHDSLKKQLEEFDQKHGF